MKKILCLVLTMLMLSACVEKKPTLIENNEDVHNDIKIIKMNENYDELVDIDDMELLGEYRWEDGLFGMEKDVSVCLYTSAQRDKKGELMWDDTQEWTLVVSSINGTYVLYDERIHGRAYMNVYKSYKDNSEESVIGLHIFGNAFNETREYHFNGEGFVENVSYTTDENSTQGISELYNSIPQYE